jgi:hypothetical protein
MANGCCGLKIKNDIVSGKENVKFADIGSGLKNLNNRFEMPKLLK